LLVTAQQKDVPWGMKLFSFYIVWLQSCLLDGERATIRCWVGLGHGCCLLSSGHLFERGAGELNGVDDGTGLPNK